MSSSRSSLSPCWRPWTEMRSADGALSCTLCKPPFAPLVPEDFLQPHCVAKVKSSKNKKGSQFRRPLSAGTSLIRIVQATGRTPYRESLHTVFFSLWDQ